MTAAVAARLPLGRDVPDVLAVGAYLKVAPCVVHGGMAWLAPDCGNQDTAENVRTFEAAARDLTAAAGAAPVAVAHDYHPDFPTTRYARESGLEAVPVQHHHAHVAAVMAEHGVVGPVLGVALDGFGLGENREAWGGELLLSDGPAYARIGHLRPLQQPGGDAAARAPWRMAAAALHDLGRADAIPERFADQPHAAALPTVLQRGINTLPTTSAGRLFDAAAALLGVCPVADFEGQAPMTLEGLVETPRVLDDGWRVTEDGVLDLRPLLDRLADTADQREGADLFHGTLAAALDAWIGAAAEAHGRDTVALGGGCLLNRALRRALVPRLEARGLRVLLPEAVSPGDPGLALGQAWAAALARESVC